ncbi:diguanylate cyclase [Baekduia soli]|uniref:Diguanylate cyclase n=1 Tax=Baekduia soli TaxID=496014 RepID=A0A5B8U2M7_9ACTN|nr:diguanylate cyclase [Baekduia soli]QEC47309.1 diguanylate cyclase [Baekduia soli]
MEAGPTEAMPGGRHISCSMTTVMLRLVGQEHGTAGIEELLAAAGVQQTREDLENEENWVTLDEAIALLSACVQVTGDPGFPRRIGEHTVRQHAGTSVSTLLRSLGSPEAVLGAIAQAAGKLSTVSDLDAVEVEPGRAVVRAVARPGHVRHPLQCQWTTGLLATPTELFGLPRAGVRELSCQAKGDPECRYVVTWDAGQAAAGADPQQRVTALEAQLLATREGLRGVFATAAELLSTDDIDVVLARIVDRAALTVRAPRFVLAVRPRTGDEVRIYAEGVADGEAAAIAQALEAGDPLPGSALVADVASERRAYGRLCALNPEGIHFFASEQELFSLYAAHAAAVLDMATALAEADRRHDHVSALLSLAQALALGGSRQDVADSIVRTVPAIVDCDRLSVWLWDDEAGCLRVASTAGPADGDIGLLDDRMLLPSGSPALARMLGHPGPLHVERGDAGDAQVHALMELLDVLVVVAVPIIARGEFLGIVVVSVAERPERLDLDASLLQRLNGIASLAAPAIQNGRLVDELQHQASHDPLTGLANRTGFSRRVDAVLDGAGHTEVGLLFCDLDGFKTINDRHGHTSGDALLREIADRLRSVVRSGDTVARLGGDEFAVILADVRSPDEIAAAAARVRAVCAEPFRVGDSELRVGVSVGQAQWPQDGRGAEELLRVADAAMYREKTRSRAA